MNKDEYKKATPIIENLELLSELILPEVKINKHTEHVDVVNGSYTDATGIKFAFSGNKYGDYNPIIDNNGSISLNEVEYNKIKVVINNIINARIKEQENLLNSIK